MKKFYIFLVSILFVSTALANNKLPQTGLASYYGDRVDRHRVACGERYYKDSFTCAHRSLPFGTYLRVTNLKNNKTVVVRVTDRGPRARKRIVDLSGAAADQLGFRRAGVTKVTIDLATPEEIKKQQDFNRDSAIRICPMIDTAAAMPEKAKPLPADDADRYMIQGGAYSYIKGAEAIKKYLHENGIENVSIKHKKRRRHRALYTVMIGPLKKAEIENVKKVLGNRGIKGFVTNL